MTDPERRWAEIRLFYFCLDIYHIRNDLMDVSYAIEAVSQIGPFKIQRIKHIGAKLIGDPSNMPSQTEFIHIAHANGLSAKQIAEKIGKTARTIRNTLAEQETPIFYPLLNESEDNEIKRFLNLLDLFQKAGIPV